MMSDKQRESYITLDGMINNLQRIRDENQGKDIRVCFSEDKMNGIYDRRRISIYYFHYDDNVVELS